MGLNLKKLGQSIQDILGGAGHVANSAVNTVLHNPGAAVQNVAQAITNPQSFIATKAVPQMVPQIAPPVSSALNSSANYLTSATQHTPVIGPVVRNVVSPLLSGYGTTVSHTGDILSGHNPYHGTIPQVVGQFGSDALNAASILPIGELIKGAQVGLKGSERLLPSVLKGAAESGLYGAGYGATSALQDKGATPLSVAESAALSGVIGATAGAASPLIGAGVRKGVKLLKGVNEVPISKLTSYEGAPDRQRVDYYKQQIQDGKSIEPLKVVPDSKGNLGVEDGKHRLQALKELGFTTAPVQSPLASERGAVKVPGGAGTTEKPKVSIKEGNKQALESNLLRTGVTPKRAGAPAPIELPTAQPGDIKTARLNSKAVSGLIADRANPAIEAANKLSPADHALLDNLRTTAPEVLAKKAENPTAFLDAAAKAKTYTDYAHALGSGQGQVVPYREKYGAPLLYDMKDPATVEALNQYQAKLQTKPGYSQMRTTPDYATGEALGLKRLNQNFAQDLSHDANLRSGHIAELTLAKNLNEAFPGQVAVGEIPRGYTQLQVPGGKAIAMPSEIADKINARASAPKVNNIALKGYDAANRGIKYTSLGGGTFHGLTTAETVAGQQLTSGNLLRHPIQNLRLVAGTLSDTVHQANMAKFTENGTVDRARLAGVTLQPGEILGDANVNLFDKAKNSHLNFIKNVHDMVFKRQIPEAKLMIFEQATKGLDPNVPADLAKMRGAASAVNNLGGINRAVEGLTPATAQKASRFVLATDFTETKARKLVDAISKGGSQGTIARQMIIGKVLVAALPGLAIAAGSGKLQTAQDWANEAAKQVLDPHVAINNKSPKGYDKIARLPGTEISELSRILLPIFQDAQDPLSGAKHYGISRLAAAPSTIWSLLTNQDYNGDSIVKTNDNGGVDVGATAKKLAISRGPIPVQNFLKAQDGTITGGEAVLNTLGLRTAVDPNDPNYKEVQQHFANQDQFLKNQDANGQALFNKLNPTKKDKNGNVIYTPNLLSRPSDYTDLQANPKFLKDYQAYQQSQPSHDPLWNLNSTQLNAYINVQKITSALPGSVTTNLKSIDANYVNTVRNSGWYQQLQKDRGSFFDQISTKTGTKAPALEGAYTQAGPEVQKVLDQMGSKGVNTSTLLAQNPQAEQWLSLHADEVNQRRVDLGLPPLPKFPSPPNDTIKQKELDYSSLPQGTGARSTFLKANPDYMAYWQQKQDYYTAIDGSSTASSSSSKYGYGNYVTHPGSVYKYAVSPTAGSSGIKKASLSVKSNGITGRKTTIAKPKVSLKKKGINAHA